MSEEKFKLQGHVVHQGIPIAIENRKGSVRKGVDADGTPWRTEMLGEIELTAPTLHQNLAGVAWLNHSTHNRPSNGLKVCILPLVFGLTGRLPMGVAIQLKCDLLFEVSQVDVESAYGMVGYEAHTQIQKPLKEQAFQSTGSQKGLPGFGDVFVPSISTIGGRTHDKSLTSKSGLYGAGGAA